GVAAGLTKPSRLQVLPTIDDLTARLVTEAPKDLANRIDPLVEVEVIGLDIEQNGVLRMEIDQGAVAFVPLGDEIVSGLVPTGVGSEDGDLGPHVVRRRLAPDPQDVGGQG